MDNLSTNSNNICRICLEPVNDVIYYCDCSNDLGNIHYNCLHYWLSTKNFTDMKCEICQYSYNYDLKIKNIFYLYSSIAILIYITSLISISYLQIYLFKGTHVMWTSIITFNLALGLLIIYAICRIRELNQVVVIFPKLITI